MKNSTLLLLLFSLCFIYPATAQHKTIVYGNLNTSNVNISIINSPIGTSTDAKGQYALTLHNQTKTINLHYSCIGYQDTVVSLSPRQLQRDSINISFKMRKQNYNLQEVTVTDTHKLQGEKYYFMDFEVFDRTICVLAAYPNKKKYCLILTDETLRGHDTIPIPAYIKPELVISDCMGNCQLVAKDSVYEIGIMTEPYKFLAVERLHYFRTMSDCLFATDKHVYFKEKVFQGYYTMFYRTDLETKMPQQLFASNIINSIDKYFRELDFNRKFPFVYTIPGIGVTFPIYNYYVKEYWYRPSDAELLLANDTLCYFEQSLGYIQRYDLEANMIDSCAIQYPFMEGWHRILYQDHAQNRFYTVIEDQLFKIDPLSGNITAITKLIPSLYSKIAIHNGQLFLLKKAHDSAGGTATFIERRKL